MARPGEGRGTMEKREKIEKKEKKEGQLGA